MTQRIVGLVQARLGSRRLPGKALLPLQGRPVVQYVLDRLAATPGIAEVVLATSDAPGDGPLVDLARQLGVRCSRGPVDDLAGRMQRVAAESGADLLVRTWGDCPCLDPAVVAQGLELAAAEAADFLRIRSQAVGLCPGGDTRGTFPYGINYQVWTRAALEAQAADPDPFIREFPHEGVLRDPGRWRARVLDCDGDYSDICLTLDYPEDLELIRAVFAALDGPGQPPASPFGFRAVAELLRSGRVRRPGAEGLARNQEYFAKKAARGKAP
jgi:spore coat polysaccharide biosynthesis protein SpsF (cytidylyltransferase family)